MRRLRPILGAAIVLAGLGTNTVFAEDKAGTAKKSWDPLGWWKKDEKPAKAEKGEKAEKPADDVGATPAASPTNSASKAAERLSARVEKELDTYRRRVAVCTELKEISIRTNDTELGHLADILEERAYQVYHEKVNALQSMDPTEVDEMLLGKHSRLHGTGAPLSGTPKNAEPSAQLNRSVKP